MDLGFVCVMYLRWNLRVKGWISFIFVKFQENDLILKRMKG